MHVEHRRDDRITIDLARGGRLGDAVAQQADVEAGAAHVHGDEPRIAARRAQVCSADHGPGWSGKERSYRIAHHQLWARHAAIRLEYEQRARDARLAHVGEQGLEVVAHHRRDVGGEHRGAGARVFAELGLHIGGGEGVDVRQRLAQPVA